MFGRLCQRKTRGGSGQVQSGSGLRRPTIVVHLRSGMLPAFCPFDALLPAIDAVADADGEPDSDPDPDPDVSSPSSELRSADAPACPCLPRALAACTDWRWMRR